MPPALWLIALPILAVPIVYVLRRVVLGAVIAALVALLSAWLATRLPTGVVLNLLGRTIELNRLSQITLALLFAATAILFLVPSLLPASYGERSSQSGRSRNRRSVIYGGVRDEGRTFYPMGLVILGLFVAASLSRHLGITAIFIEAAAILTVFVIQGGRLESIRAALRFLALMSLATPIFLLAAWQIDFYQLSGGLESAKSLQQITLLVGFGFALWLAVVPFHGWLTTTAAEASPPTAAFVLIAFPTIAFSTIIGVLADFPWLVDSPQAVRAVILAGIVTALVGGILASVQRGFSELMGYAALYDLGCTLTVLGIGGRAGVITILVSLIVRALALVLIAASASAIRLRLTDDGFTQIKGIIQQMPVATAGLIVGGLTLAGVPFTAGFAPRWQLFRSMAEIEPYGVALLALAGLGVAVGYLRGFRATLPSRVDKLAKRSSVRPGLVLTLQEPLLLLIIISLLGIITLLLGFFPFLLIEPLQTLVTGVALPI